MSADTLTRIIESKQREVAAGRHQHALSELRSKAVDMPPCRDFLGALESRISAGQPAVIAEIKRASPSAGPIRPDLNPAAMARAYQSGGAACLSVLTDRDWFGARSGDLDLARQACTLPVLRKDFIIDPWQVYQTRAMGADALLLIVAALDDARLAELHELGDALGLAVLIEVHDAAELARALALPGRLVGINNRDLRRFRTRLETSIELAPTVPADRVVVAESGIGAQADIDRLRQAGIGAFLIGESLMRQPDPGLALAELIGRS